MTRVALINPNWEFGGSIYFGYPYTAGVASLPVTSVTQAW